MRNIVLFVLLCLLAACQHSVIEDVGETSKESLKSVNTYAMQTVVDKKNEWQAKDISNYSFVWKNSCYCMQEYTQAIKVQVKNGVIDNANYLESGLEVGSEVRESIKTFEQVFAMLEKYVDKADKVSVSYDDEWSVPEKIFIDRDVRMADEEITLSLSDFEEL